MLQFLTHDPSCYHSVPRSKPFQPLLLNASASVDDDAIDFLPFVFSWRCEDDAGDACTAPNGDVLESQGFGNENLLSLPAGALPVGELQRGYVCKHARDVDLKSLSNSFAQPSMQRIHQSLVSIDFAQPHAMRVQMTSSWAMLYKQVSTTPSSSPQARAMMMAADPRGRSTGVTTLRASSPLPRKIRCTCL